LLRSSIRSLEAGCCSAGSTGRRPRYAGHDVTTFEESGLNRTLGAAQPFAGLDASQVSTGGFSEHGAGSVDLVASDASTTSVRTAVGIRATRSFAALSGIFAPRVEVRYLHELRDRGVGAGGSPHRRGSWSGRADDSDSVWIIAASSHRPSRRRR
jgi:outer membrane autotransporter protein